MAVTDPDLGEFDEDRILRCLSESGANHQKINATRKFLEDLEDYDAAVLEGSRLREFTGWKPEGERIGDRTTIDMEDPMAIDEWTSVWAEFARVRGTTYIAPVGEN